MHKIFDFLNDENYKLMLDMSKETHKKNERIEERYSSIDKKEFFEICHEHELDGVVGCYAKYLGLELPDYWETEYIKQEYRQNYLRAKAIEICALMDKAGIPLVILKNGGIMISMIPEAVKCPMEDIDSLVKKKDFYKANEILKNSGFTLKFRSDFEKDDLEDAYRHGSAEYFITLPDNDKMWFELSWRAIDGRWIRPDLEPDTDSFIDRSFMPKGTKAHVLSPEDNLLQVCIHTAKHSYCRAPGLRLHIDVDRIVAHNDINWDLFLEKVKASHVCRSTYLSLYIPSVLFETEIPTSVLNELQSKQTSRLLDMLANAGLPHPKEKKFSKLQFLLFQSYLYDGIDDMVHTLKPDKTYMDEHYGCKNSAERLLSYITRCFDLLGIRKRK